MAIEINKVYTRTGDRGRTALSDGSRRLKCDLRVEAYGLTDHLNSFIGSLYCALTDEKYADISKQLEEIQQVMFNLGAELSLPGELPEKTFYPPVSDAYAAKLDQCMDALGKDLTDLPSFVLPGSDELNARAHL